MYIKFVPGIADFGNLCSKVPPGGQFVCNTRPPLIFTKYNVVCQNFFLRNTTWEERSASWKLSLSFGVFLDPSVFLEFSPPQSLLIFSIFLHFWWICKTKSVTLSKNAILQTNLCNLVLSWVSYKSFWLEFCPA